MPTASNTTASLWRRLAAILYDAFLVVALWFVTTTLIVAFLNDGEIIAGPFFQLFLYLEAGAFYAYFWHIKGQTLGMQVWKIKLVTAENKNITLEVNTCNESWIDYIIHNPNELLKVRIKKDEKTVFFHVTTKEIISNNEKSVIIVLNETL